MDIMISLSTTVWSMYKSIWRSIKFNKRLSEAAVSITHKTQTPWQTNAPRKQLASSTNMCGHVYANLYDVGVYYINVLSNAERTSRRRPKFGTSSMWLRTPSNTDKYCDKLKIVCV